MFSDADKCWHHYVQNFCAHHYVHEFCGVAMSCLILALFLGHGALREGRTASRQPQQLALFLSLLRAAELGRKRVKRPAVSVTP